MLGGLGLSLNAVPRPADLTEQGFSCIHVGGAVLLSKGGGVAPGMPTLERQVVSAPSWGTCLRPFIGASDHPLRFDYHLFAFCAAQYQKWIEPSK